MAARCLTASSCPSNQVTSTLNSLPQYSAACLPWAHQVACSPALEKAAFNGFSDRPAASATSAAKAELKPKPPNMAAAAPAETEAVRIKSRRERGVESLVIISSVATLLAMVVHRCGPFQT